MAHELNTTADGRASMAYVGQTPWHGLGQKLSPGADLITWQQEAGLDWEAKLATVRFEREVLGMTGSVEKVPSAKSDSCVIYRSDTGDALSVVSNRYRPVQPRDVIEFYRDLTEWHGYTLETAGALKGGRKIWALAKTPATMSLRGNDAVHGYLLLATSYDGTMATQARFTSIRVVCNNTLTFAANEGRADVTVPHNTTFDADKVKIDLQVGDAWVAFERNALAMSNRVVGPSEAVPFLLDVYYGLSNREQIEQFDRERGSTAEKFIARMQKALFESPGAHMASARGTLWGLLNAVTYDVDHTVPARSQENRLNASWFGRGEVIKQKAWSKALEMVA